MWSLRSWMLAAVAGFSLSIPSQALYAQTTPTPEEQALRQRVEDLERKLKQLEDRLEQQAQPGQGTGGVPPAAAAAKAPEPEEAAKPAEPSAQDQAMQKQIDELNQQVKSLEKIQQGAQVIPAQRAEAPNQAGTRQGISITSPNGDLQLRLRALLQVDYRDYQDQQSPNTAVNTFLLRRVRPILEGTAYEKFDFRFTPDFGNSTDNGTTTQSIPQIYDAYIDANLYQEFKVRVGKFKPPLGLERLQSAGDLTFAERAFPTLLVPNRDIGLMAFGDVFDRRLFYAAGVFNGAVDNALSQTGDANNGKDFDLRLYAQPWLNTNLKALRGLGFGIAYGHGSQKGVAVTNSQLPTYLTPGQQSFFTYSAGAFASGERTTWAPQLYYSVGPFGVLGEYTNTAQFVSRSTNTQNVSNNAWQVALSWVLTGEDASFRGVIPSNRFNLSKGHWGDVELVARVSQLKVDSNAYIGPGATQLANPSTQASKATDYGIGIGWDLSREVRIMLDYDQTSFTGGAAKGADRPDEKVIITRFQYSL
jgi:phosphate-selective porin OprO/OprP